MKIHLISVNADKHFQRLRLEELWEKSSRRYKLIQNSKNADIILVTDLAGPDWFHDLRFNPVIAKNPEKSFAISDSDFPMPLLHGIYTSASRKLIYQKRFRSAAYNLYPEEYLNPLIKNHPGNAYDHSKKYLYSFAGRDSSDVRIRLFKLHPGDDACVINTTSRFAAFGPSPEPKSSWQKQYVELMNQSKYAICPRGVGSASLRIFESMQMGVAPVILSDDWIYPEGPDWKSFAIIILEKDIKRLPEIIKVYESEYQKRGKLARKAYEAYFSNDTYFDYLIDVCINIRQNQKVTEKFFWFFRNAIVEFWKLKRRVLGL